MNHEEFNRLHRECEQLLDDWISEAKITCTMLGECLNEPLSLQQRSDLHTQRARENEARDVYMAHRKRLFELARSGYGDLELIYAPFSSE